MQATSGNLQTNKHIQPLALEPTNLEAPSSILTSLPEDVEFYLLKMSGANHRLLSCVDKRWYNQYGFRTITQSMDIWPRSIPVAALSYCKSLTLLNLARVEEEGDWTGVYAPSVEILVDNYNLLTDDIIGRFPNLTSLRLMFNDKLTDVGLKKLTKLTQLTLNDSCHDVTIGGIKHLKLTDISGLKHISEEELRRVFEKSIVRVW